jgi:hypothetical protein
MGGVSAPLPAVISYHYASASFLPPLLSSSCICLIPFSSPRH